jgi:hypothetical protein
MISSRIEKPRAASHWAVGQAPVSGTTVTVRAVLRAENGEDGVRGDEVGAVLGAAQRARCRAWQPGAGEIQAAFQVEPR